MILRLERKGTGLKNTWISSSENTKDLSDNVCIVCHCWHSVDYGTEVSGWIFYVYTVHKCLNIYVLHISRDFSCFVFALVQEIWTVGCNVLTENDKYSDEQGTNGYRREEDWRWRGWGHRTERQERNERGIRGEENGRRERQEWGERGGYGGHERMHGGGGSSGAFLGGTGGAGHQNIHRRRAYEEGPGEPNIQSHMLLRRMCDMIVSIRGDGADGLQLYQVIEELERRVREREMCARLIRIGTDESRCFAFAKFISVEHARQFIDAHFPYLYMGNNRVRISYSKENRGDDDGWICRSCGINNYPRREVCFRCGLAKQDATVAGNLTHAAPLVLNDGSQDVSTTPSQFLLLRKLDPLTTEELIVKGMAKLQVPIVRVLLIRDRMTRQSWGFAFVEYADVNGSSKALANSTNFSSNKGFTISSKSILLSFIHGGVFVPVYGEASEFVFRASRTGQLLAYWDEKGYTSEHYPEGQKPDYESTTLVGESSASSGFDTVNANDPSIVCMKAPVFSKDVSVGSKRDASSLSEQKKPKKRCDNSSIKMAPHLQKWAVKQQELRTGQALENETKVESFSDLNLMACLLCQRQFKSEKEIEQHEKLSELHKVIRYYSKTLARQRLKRISMKRESEIDNLNDNNYRDRAQERRIAFNQPSKPDIPSYSSKKSFAASHHVPEESANITKGKGAAILGKMGWTEGMGLGLEGKGIAEPVKAEAYQEGVGLGSVGAKLGENPRPSDYAAYVRSVKDRAKQRYETEEL
ncbi:hypothetical protein PMAC_000605 [Pneumocystis sp. 'macacae']|nr:hypothetical protein PMAC_000605 [Pneumocystis sp. 'macacae']